MQSNSIILNKVLPNFFITLLFSFLGAWVSNLFIPVKVALFIGFLPLSVLLFLFITNLFKDSKRSKKKLKFSSYGIVFPMWLVHLFTISIGIGVAPTLNVYAGTIGTRLIAISFLISILLFFILFVYGFLTKKDFSFLGSALAFSLITLLILSVVNIFLNINIIHLILSFFGIVIFSLYVLYDLSQMKHESFTEQDVPAAVFDLFLDFINIFLNVLDIIYRANK